MNLDTKVKEWRKEVQKLAEVKEKEKELRLEIFNEMERLKAKKLQYIGFSVTSVPRTNYKVDEKVFKSILNDLSEAEKKAIKTKYSMDKLCYDKLPPDTLLNKAITESPGMPALNIKEK
jgi:hypothetical protein